ncbi:MAG TPA: glutamine--tRNA ligase/YqeY domain fusion protein [Longimicrobiales bacterium]|nr:glutamine--tRNA ligase/YqeY domain fusion protein [Longimicrobiales bacterium]
MSTTTKDHEAAGAERAPGLDFIRAMIAEDLRTGRFGGNVVTRFPPEPNGFLHIGHAKSICLNFGIADEVAGARCHLRFDDTNPETEDIRYVEAAMEDVRWLGFDWGDHLYFASDYFERMYAFAEHLIKEGLAYVDSSSEEEIREARGTVLEPGRPTAYRGRPAGESLDLFRRMRAGEFSDGAHVLRARIDLASPNMLMRDPVLYRIRHAEHYRQGSAWCIYPLYDYAHPIEDAIECVTHSLCTLEFENNRELYDWVVDNLPRGEDGRAIPQESRPEQTEFARLALDYTVMSKRKLLQLVNDASVSGWDDPRMPTLAGLRRRGVTPEAIRAFCDLIGVGKANTRVDIAKLEYAIRDDLNQRSPRVMCVLRPLRVVLTNWPAGHVELVDAPYWPHDVPGEGTRPVPFSGELYIEADDFREDPPRGWFRLAPGREIRLRYGYIIRCDEVVRDDAGGIVELRCSYDPATQGGAVEGRTVKGTLHWVSAAHAVPCEVRLYDRLFTVPDPEAGTADFRTMLNPDSLVTVTGALAEPSIGSAAPGDRFQFERLGYFVADSTDSRPGSPVFNRTVTLRDTWARKETGAEAKPSDGRPDRSSPKRGVPDIGSKAGDAAVRSEAVRAERSPELDATRSRYVSEHGLSGEQADILTRDPAVAAFFEAALGASPRPHAVAKWIVNEIPRDAREGLAELPVDGSADGRLVELVEAGTITGSAGREVMAELLATGGEPEAIVERRGLGRISDEAELRGIVDAVVAANPAKADEYRAGRAGLLGFFIGQVMGRTGGRASPDLARRLVTERLEG